METVQLFVKRVEQIQHILMRISKGFKCMTFRCNQQSYATPYYEHEFDFVF